MDYTRRPIGDARRRLNAEEPILSIECDPKEVQTDLAKNWTDKRRGVSQSNAVTLHSNGAVRGQHTLGTRRQRERKCKARYYCFL